MARKKTTQGKRRKKHATLPVINHNCAGIDIGSRSHYVAIPADRDKEPVKNFGCYTDDLYALADWLKSCDIDSVAMESTGVYWIPIYQILEQQGFGVKLVNAKHVKNVPGRKTDVEDCQWLQQLNTFGLLRGSFRPDDNICVLRSYMRQRETNQNDAKTHIQRMQKALEQMNIQLHKVISDITGKTGIAIIEAILAGERDPEKLAHLRNYRIKKSTKEIAKALRGDWREEHLFTLKQEYELYRYYLEKVRECDEQIKQCLETIETAKEYDEQKLSENTKRARKSSKNTAMITIGEHLRRITGVDLTKIPCLDVLSVLKIISECGIDPTRWPTEKHFTSWLALCPNNEITGDKVKRRGTRKVKNRAADTFRICAMSLERSRTSLGAFFRRMKKRHGPAKAITAAARKLAVIFYEMLASKEQYKELGMDYYEQKYKERYTKYIIRQAQSLGLTIVENKETTEKELSVDMKTA